MFCVVRPELFCIISVTQYLAGGQPGLSSPVIKPTRVQQTNNNLFATMSLRSANLVGPDWQIAIFLLTDRGDRGGDKSDLGLD